MKRFAASLIFVAVSSLAGADGYVDHRGHNVDSLETAVARWTAPMIEKATDEQLAQLDRDWRELMLGYLQTNQVKSSYYARLSLNLAEEKGWQISVYDASKVIGQHFWARNQYDSAGFYYGKALHAIDLMAAEASSLRNPEGYSKKDIDNAYSAMYGTLGNLYSIQDSVPAAMDYYGKALDIFKSYKWLNSCSACCYNMAETLLGTGDTRRAKRYYGESLDYARQAEDSLWIASALKGFGSLYLTTGNTRRALKCLEEADKYFSLHEDEEFIARMETLDFTSQVLKMQKRSLAWLLAASLAGLILMVALLCVMYSLRTARKEQKETEAVFNETLDEMKPVPSGAPAVIETSSDICGYRKEQEIKLNDREIDILRKLACGRTTPQIADEICLSAETVKWYRKKLLVKFDASSSVELVIKAKEMGFIS